MIVAHESRVVMDETLEAGLRRLFGDGAAPPGAAAVSSVGSAAPATVDRPSTGASALIRQAAQHYERARAAQRADDWTTYGVEMRLLGETLKRLDTASARQRRQP